MMMDWQVDYIEAPFAAEWGTQEWIDDAVGRCRRASEEFVLAATALAMETDPHLSVDLMHKVDETANLLIRSKWLRRDIVRATERLVVPVSWR